MCIYIYMDGCIRIVSPIWFIEHELDSVSIVDDPSPIRNVAYIFQQIVPMKYYSRSWRPENTIYLCYIILLWCMLQKHCCLSLYPVCVLKFGHSIVYIPDRLDQKPR